MPLKRLATQDQPRRISWPEDATGPFDHRGLFEPRHSYRRIRVMVDAELLDSAAPEDEPAQLLRVLTGSPLVDLIRFADDGPPGYVRPDPADPNPPGYDDWAILDRWQDGWDVRITTSSGRMLAGIHGNADIVAAADTASRVYDELPEDQAAATRSRDAIAAQVASQAVEADLFVTERKYLHEGKGRTTRTSTICTVHEALALLGLYLRAQGVYLTSHQGYPVRYNRGLFTLVGTRELLYAAWRWITGLAQHDQHLNADDLFGDESMFGLGWSVLVRVERALASRDALHIAVNRPQHNDTADDILAGLDECLVGLMSAFDVTARVIHRAFSLSGPEYSGVGWQKSAWRDKARAVAPDLAAVMDGSTMGADCLEIVRLLRNYLHAQALRSVHVRASARPGRNLVQLPTQDVTALLAAMDRQGGRDRWGVEPSAVGAPFIDAAAFIDAAFESSIPTMNRIMEETPVESLAGVNLRPEHCGPPTDDHGWFAPRARRSIRWQYGL